MSTRLYHMMFVVCSERHKEINHKVWDPTPWVINVKSGSEATEEGIMLWQTMRNWLINNLGPESQPIFGIKGYWHRGSATVDGWTFIGFSSEALMISFMSAFQSHTTLDTPERHASANSPVGD